MELTLAELRELAYLVNNGLEVVPVNSDRFIIRLEIRNKIYREIKQLTLKLNKSDSK